MKFIDFPSIIEAAWKDYGDERTIRSILDISVMVSTNHVYRVKFTDHSYVFAKLSYFGQYKYFKEEHTIISVLANTLAPRYTNFLARSLLKHGEVFVYRFQDEEYDAWVVFYKEVKIKQLLPKRQNQEQIKNLGREIALFHKACADTMHELPHSSKTIRTDINFLLAKIETEDGQFEYRMHQNDIRKHCERLLNNLDALGYDTLKKIPVFVDWNIGNFSITKGGKLFSRWDYDWFRICNRVMDFYFFSRVVSEGGDQTVFSYLVDTLMEERFLMFLKAYHAAYPLTETEIHLMKEAYRFFILNYVIKDGRHFFHSYYATRLQKEAFDVYLPLLDRKFKPDKILKALDL